MKCLYNNSLDAIAAAAIVALAYPECTMEMVSRTMDLDQTTLPDGELWMIGCRFGDPYMQHLAAQYGPYLYWIDYLNVSPSTRDPSIAGLRADNFGIGELTYQFIHGIPAARCPRAIRLIGRYAVDDHDYHDDVIPFYWGMMAIKDLHESHQVWKPLLLGDDREEVAVRVMAGRAIAEYVEAEKVRRANAI